ncbi:MAG: hypothetical protein SF052_26520 [Bacteroidia bacterium]|nr:hypothetical protein [Bacteroidia bacterium]
MPTTITEIKEILKELALAQQEVKDRFKETDAKFKETDAKFKEMALQSKETDKRIKSALNLFEGQWGKLMESLVEGDMVQLLKKRGISINRTSQRIRGNYRGHNYEFDIIAHNGEEIVVVEVKTTLRVKHVQDFLDKLSQIRTWIPSYAEDKVYGAIAYLRAEENSDVFAEKEKLFVIRATGNSAAIVNPPEFEPRVF